MRWGDIEALYRSAISGAELAYECASHLAGAGGNQVGIGRLDLSTLSDCHEAVRGIDTVYNLAADTGGIGFIETYKAQCMLSVLINTHLLIAARDANVNRFLLSSSACVHNADRQVDTNVTALKESDAYSAIPEDGYRR